MDIKTAYTELEALCEKYVPVFSKDPDSFHHNIFRKALGEAKKHLKIIEYQEKYGLNLKHDIDALSLWAKIDEYRILCFLNGNERKIPWPDDGIQPVNEYFYEIRFPTGAYIFGEDYPVDIFQKFLDELKSYKPDHIDSCNTSLYFKLENAKKIHDEFPNILQKYHILNKEEAKARKIKKMEEELEKLKAKLSPVGITK